VERWREEVAANATDLARTLKHLLKEDGIEFKIPKITVVLLEKLEANRNVLLATIYYGIETDRRENAVEDKDSDDMIPVYLE
jgi:hypothetical protein